MTTTALTELFTGVGMLPSVTPTRQLPIPPPELIGVTGDVWEAVLDLADQPEHRPLADAALANGRRFLQAAEALRGRVPRLIEWRGPTRSPGDEVAPIDLLVDHVYLVSCKYMSNITVNASPAHLFERLLTGGHGRRSSGDWFDDTAPQLHRDLFRAAVAEVGAPIRADHPGDVAKADRKALAQALAGRTWPDALAPKYQELVAEVAAVSARRWQDRLHDRRSQESMLWRMLRIGAAPYFVLGAHQRSGTLCLRVGTPWNWRQSFEFRGLDIQPAAAGQPQVNWVADYHDRVRDERRSVRGHVEIRWSHGRFSGPPEAKVYLDTPHHDVPGYFPIDAQ